MWLHNAAAESRSDQAPMGPEYMAMMFGIIGGLLIFMACILACICYLEREKKTPKKKMSNTRIVPNICPLVEFSEKTPQKTLI